MATATKVRKNVGKKKVTKKSTTNLYLVLDASGSMAGLRKNVVDAVNKIILDTRISARESKEEVKVNILTFDYCYNIKHVVESEDINDVKLVDSAYRPNGATALLDATAQAINHGLDNEIPRNEETYVLMVFTDGYENDSKAYTGPRLQALINRAQRNGNWTITFQGPRGSKQELVRLGVSNDNVREWEQTEKGTRELATSGSLGMTNYFVSKSRGFKAVDDFYVQTDLSNLRPSQVKRQLTNVSDKFGIFSVARESRIDDFVEQKTKRVYNKGDAFYQLTKTELVQSYKEILVFDKTSTAIYTGEEARDLIGLPVGANAKVVPGNHANYEIFVQSTSFNRKLKPGTKVAVRI